MAPDPRKPTPGSDRPATLDPFGQDPAHPPPRLRIADVEVPATLVLFAPAPEQCRGDRPGAAAIFEAAPAWLARLRALLPSRTGRCPDVGSLTDRQLADIGLARRDVEAHPGWRGATGRSDHDR